MERSREKSNIPRPSTFNISSQDGKRVDWEIKQEDSTGCVLHLQRSCSKMEICLKRSDVFLLSVNTEAFLHKWKVAKKIMES